MDLVVHTRGYRHWLTMRLFVKDGDVSGLVAQFKAGFKMYSLSETANPPEQVFHNFSGKKYSSVHFFVFVKVAIPLRYISLSRKVILWKDIVCIYF